MSPTELRHRIAFGERQHEHFLRRVVQAQLWAQVAVAMGDLDAARSHLDCAKRHMDFVSDCNDAIDASRRALEPGDGDA